MTCTKQVSKVDGLTGDEMINESETSTWTSEGFTSLKKKIRNEVCDEILNLLDGYTPSRDQWAEQAIIRVKSIKNK